MLAPLLLLLALCVAFFAGFAFILDRARTDARKLEPPQLPEGMGWSVLVAVAALNLFAYDAGSGAGIGLFLCGIIGAVLLSFERKRRTPAVWILSLVGALSALALGWRGNEFVWAADLTAAFLCCTALLLLRTLERPFWHGLWLLRSLGSFLGRHIGHLPGFLRHLGSGGDGKSRRLGVIVRTLLITLVVVVFFAWLLSSADPVFGSMVDRVMDQMLGRVIVSLLLAAFLCLTLSLRVQDREHRPPSLAFFGFHEAVVPSVALALLFAAFLAVQARYLLGSHDAVKAFDLTYSEYVRRGFIELLVATFFGTLLSYLLVAKRAELGTDRRARLLQGVNVVIVLELFLLLASALKRDWLYMDTYGLTRVRLIGEAFLVWLAGVLFLLLLLDLLPRMREKQFLSGALALTVGILAYWNGVNMDMRVVNAAPPRSQPMDVFYVSQLSTDAADGWMRAIQTGIAEYDSFLRQPQNTAARAARLADLKLMAAVLQEKRDEVILAAEDDRWLDGTVSQRAAYELIRANPRWFRDGLDCLSREILDLGNSSGIDIGTPAASRFSDYSYPFVDVRDRSFSILYPADPQPTDGVAVACGG